MAAAAAGRARAAAQKKKDSPPSRPPPRNKTKQNKTTAPAALLPVIRDAIDLTRTDLGNAGIAAVCGAIFSRVAMGNFVDNYGPRYGIALCIGITAPAVFCIGLSMNAAGFIISRLFIGFSLATFVACQFWCTSMFTTRIVGSANAFAAGWGNMGGGVTHFIMPLIFDGIKNGGVAPFTAWRWSFFVPAAFQVLLTFFILAFAQDMPDGQYKDLRASGAMSKPGGWPMWKAALFNYRTWVMTLTYGYCFGVELVSFIFVFSVEEGGWRACAAPNGQKNRRSLLTALSLSSRKP